IGTEPDCVIARCDLGFFVRVQRRFFLTALGIVFRRTLGGGSWPLRQSAQRANGEDDQCCKQFHSLITSVCVSAFVMQLPIRGNQFDLNLPLLSVLSLIGWRVEENVFESEVVPHLRERLVQLYFLRWKKQLPAGVFAQPPQFLVIRVLDLPGGDALKILGAYAEDGDVVLLGHLNGLSKRVLA